MVTWSSPVGSTGSVQAIVQTAAVSQAWHPGTLLKAIALSNSRDGLVQLQIGARVVTAQSSLPLQTGQSLRLEVIETGRTVILKSIGQPSHDPVRVAMRQNLPRQTAQTPLLNTAVSLARSGAQYPAQLRNVATQLVSSIPNAAAMTQGPSLRQAVINSGIFLESRLAQATITHDPQLAKTLTGDWKVALLRFRDQLNRVQIKLAGDSVTRPAEQPINNTPTQRAGTVGNAPGSLGVAATVANASSTSGPRGVVQGNALPVQAVSLSAVLPIAGSAGQVSAASAVTPQPATDKPMPLQVPLVSRNDVVPRDIAPPLRDAMPQAQPLARVATLLADPLSLIGELINDSEGAIARLRLNQLGSVTPEQSSRQVWLLEIPLQHTDDRTEVISLRIEQDQEDNETGTGSGWTADLAFDLGEKGSLSARVALRAGQVSVLFRADVEQTRKDVQQKLPQLQTAMEKKQLEVATLSAGTGQAPGKPVLPASVLETRA